MTTVNPELQRLVDEALDLGFRCIGERDHAAFFILIAGKERQLTDLQSADGTMSEALLQAGRAVIRKSAESGQYYVLVWDGYLTTVGKRQDAVLAEAGAAGEGQGFVFAQRYKQTKSGKLSKLGKRLVAAEVAHLWSKASV
jgi:hypothetical protein